jgi:hypothetical protein
MNKTLYTKQEISLFKKLNTPQKIQAFLNTLKYNFDVYECKSPRRVLEEGNAYCIEGALLAAAILQFHGHKPLLLDLRAKTPDYDHVFALFKQNGSWGALSKTNHGVLRYRDPIYRTVRELVLSCFHEYFLDSGVKTMRDYSRPFDVSRFDKQNWQIDTEDIWYIPDYLDTVPHINLLTPIQIRALRLAEPIEIALGKITEWKKNSSTRKAK